MSSFNAGKIEADLTLGRSAWTRDLRKTKREIAELERKSITVEIDVYDDNARVAMDNLEMMLDDLGNNTYTPSIEVRTQDASLEAFEEKLDRIDNRILSVEADADVTNAIIQLDILENHMDVLENDPINIRADVDAADAQQDLIELGLAVQRLDLSDINIQADVDSMAAQAQLAALSAQVDLLDGRDIDIDVDVDHNSLERLVGTGGAAGGGGGGGSLGLLRILIYAIILLSPILGVAIGAATAAIIAFAAAVAAAGAAAVVLAGGLVGLVQRFKDTDPSDYTPAMERFADAIERVKDAYDAFLDSIATPGYDLMTSALDIVAEVLPTLVPLFNAVAKAMDGVLDSLAKWIDSPQYKEMIAFFSDFGVDMLVTFLEIGGNLLIFFGELFAAIEPFARAMMTGLEELTEGWAKWAEGLDKNQAFQEFMDNALLYGPMVLDMLGSMVDAFMNIGEALRPFAGPMLTGLTTFFDFIANMDPDILNGLIGGFAGLYAGVKIVLPILSGISGAITAITTASGIGLGPIALVAGAIAAIVIAVMQLWDESQRFRDSVIGTWRDISDTVTPIIEDIWAAIQENWGPIKEWAAELWGSLKGIIEDVMAIIEIVIGGTLEDIDALWSDWGDDLINFTTWIFGILGDVITGGFDVIEGIFNTILAILEGDWGAAWEGIKQIGQGALNAIGGILRLALDPLRRLWGAITGALSDMWSNAMGFFRTEWNNFRTWIGERWAAFRDWISGWAPNFPAIWDGIQTEWGNMREWIAGRWDSFREWITGWAPNFPAIWDGIQTAWTNMREWITGRWQSLKDTVSGWAVNASGLWDGIKEGFRSVLNTIVGWWNNFSLTLNIPDAIPGMPDSFTISTPNVGGYATGAYVPGNKPHLAWFGEGPDNEVVAPEPILRRIVEEHSGGNIDYGRLAAAVAQALGSVLNRMNSGITREDIERLIEAAGVKVDIDARGDGTAELAEKLGFELRVLGFGG